MYDNQVFAALVAEGKPTGEVLAVNRMLTEVKGLEGATVNSLILFENGDRGIVRSLSNQMTTVLSLSPKEVPIGTLAVLEEEVYQAAVGPEMVGRVLNVLGEPLDGKGPINATTRGRVFAPAPGIIERKALSDQLVTGVAIVDALFPLMLGQRMAVLGDSKSGKSTFLRQLTKSQLGTDHIIVYVLVAKRQVDIDTLLADLTDSGVLQQTVVIVSSSFDSLALSYLAPYVGCAIGEHLWKESGRNTIMIYDDLSNHAKVYRELSLIAEVSPGRDSYPGDMFYAHSSLLERAGRLASNGATQNAFPVILTPNDDITAYLPTSVMSITDGQLIFDLQSFRKGIRPAVNVGLSVSRVGGKAETKAWKDLTQALFKKLASYRQAAEFAQFGSELTEEARADLELGKMIYEAFRQTPQELYKLNEQYLLLQTIMQSAGHSTLNISLLKQKSKELSGSLDTQADLAPLVGQLLAEVTVQAAAAPVAAAPDATPVQTAAGAEAGGAAK
jgi:F-type H+-transporting ATPase subunit alpha